MLKNIYKGDIVRRAIFNKKQEKLFSFPNKPDLKKMLAYEKDSEINKAFLPETFVIT